MQRLMATSVLVVGDVLLDVYVDGSADRVSPEAPVPVIQESERWATLGGAANVAATVTAFGASATLVGRVGTDAEGDEVLALCAERGIDASGVVRSSRLPTIRKTRIVARYQQTVRVDREVVAPLSDDERVAVLAAVDDFVRAGAGARAVVISDYAKGLLDPELAAQVTARAGEAGVPVVADPKHDLACFRGVTILKPNLAEARAAVGPSPLAGDDPEERVRALAKGVREVSGAENVVLSLSEHGAIGVGADAPVPVRLATRAVDVADVSGAGDTMSAFLAMGLAVDLGFARTMVVANAAAGIVCGKRGTATVGATELTRTLAHSATHPSKWLTSPEEMRLLGEMYARDRGHLVFANGCFDVLHAGHVHMLQHARRLGDGLVVALNSDDSVTRLKGQGRPVNHIEDRVAVIGGLECVDHVVVFEEDTPLRLIERIRPHVIVKGGDYRPDDVVGAAEVASWGGRVEIVPLVPGRSTTEILRRGRA